MEYNMYKLEYKKIYKTGKVWYPYIRFNSEKEAKLTIKYLTSCTKNKPGKDDAGEFWIEDLKGNNVLLN